MQIPSAEQITALHQKYAPHPAVFELVYTHSQIVHDIAVQLHERQPTQVDMELVRAGCMLHDIGVYALYGLDGGPLPGAPYITHGIKGEKILRAEGMAEALWRIASHHTGVGLTQEDITSQNLPLPVTDYLAETAEERLVMYADKFHSKITPPCFNSYDWYQQDVTKFGDTKAAQFAALAEEFGKPDLAPLVAQYGHSLR